MVTSVNPSSLRVSWQPPPEIDHNGVITGYVIEYTRSGGSSDMVTVTSGTTRTISGLVPFVEYSVTVAAMTDSGTGPFIDPVVQTSGQDSKTQLSVFYKLDTFLGPSVPRSLTLDSITDTTVSLSWMTPNPTNGIITEYRLQYKRCSSGDSFSVLHLNTAVTRTVTGLAVDTEYCFRVRAFTVVKPGPWTDEVMGRTCESHMIQVMM